MNADAYETAATSALRLNSGIGGARRRPASDPHPRRFSQGASQFAVWGKRSQKWRCLIVAAQRGERRAYDQLLRELDAWLSRYYARRLPRAAAEDARQDALLAVHAKLHTYTPSKPFGPWLAAIARYKWIDHLRDASRFAALPLDEDVPVKDGENAAISAISVEELLSRLKPAQATVIRLVKLHGVSIEEASGATGQSVPLVKVNIHRGLKKLAALATADTWTPAVVGA
jgi:RNA polymerase sigma factor (sigma-70 family)